MNDDLHDLAVGYALDALDLQERRSFETHLDGCAACRAEVAELQEAAADLSAGLESAPPPDLRGRILSQVQTEQVQTHQAPDRAAGRHRSSDRRRWLAAAAAVLVVAGGWGASQLLSGQEDPAHRIVQAQDAQEHEADTADGELIVITSAAEDAAVLQVPDRLTAPPEGSVYQAWYVGPDGDARSAGLLTPAVLDTGETVLEGSPGDAAAVALTVEPSGGSDQPTSEPFAVVPLG
ncbi:anti-sigma factor [Ornithinimicrobium avium]|uniref:Regulator of SigK n=1 Tax=Ornithinimicrobium avium TaxID=2283195 RepID=A0A345NKL8_9MICO|nr:anti-sigma factor [Ornithinimicrobium avium]AXH95576.1 anti-sigma factor [Ornithinimicrobium avium]